MYWNKGSQVSPVNHEVMKDSRVLDFGDVGTSPSNPWLSFLKDLLCLSSFWHLGSLSSGISTIVWEVAQWYPDTAIPGDHSTQ